MKSDKKLQAVFKRAKGDNEYYTFEYFKSDAKNFLKDIRKHRVVAGVQVSRSGMTRHFNTQRYNMLLNICYNQKLDWQPVRVSGCGMDMWWHLLFRTCEDIATKGEMEKWSLNMACSLQTIL